MQEDFCEQLEIPKPEKIENKFAEAKEVRPIEEVAKRATALYLIATFAEGVVQRNCPFEESQKFIQKMIGKFAAHDYFTEKEKEFLENETLCDTEVGVFCWRWESLRFMLWAFGFIQELGLPNEPGMQFQCAKVFNNHRTVEAFVKAAKPLPLEKIVEAANQLEYVASNKDAAVDLGVLTEWRKAAYWLLTNNEWH
jgi:hypothetical protein